MSASLAAVHPFFTSRLLLERLHDSTIYVMLLDQTSILARAPASALCVCVLACALSMPSRDEMVCMMPFDGRFGRIACANGMHLRQESNGARFVCCST